MSNSSAKVSPWTEKDEVEANDNVQTYLIVACVLVIEWIVCSVLGHKSGKEEQRAEIINNPAAFVETLSDGQMKILRDATIKALAHKNNTDH